MKSHRAITSAFAFLALGAALTVGGNANAMPMSGDQMKMWDNCRSMSDRDMMKNHECMGMMKMMHVTRGDMMHMNSCRAMNHDAMMGDKTCMMMMRKHPDMMK